MRDRTREPGPSDIGLLREGQDCAPHILRSDHSPASALSVERQQETRSKALGPGHGSTCQHEGRGGKSGPGTFAVSFAPPKRCARLRDPTGRNHGWPLGVLKCPRKESNLQPSD